MTEGNRKREDADPDPSQLERMLEIEMIQKRAAWQQARTQRASFRTFSFVFLFVIIVAALVGFYLFLSPGHIEELKAGHSPATTTATPATAAP